MLPFYLDSHTKFLKLANIAYLYIAFLKKTQIEQTTTDMIATLILSALAVGITAWLLPGVGIDSWLWTFVIAIVLGIINTVVKPVVKLLALPVNIITLGLFSLVINALMIELCAAIVPAFHVESLWWAFLYSVVLSIVTWLIGVMFDR